MSANAVSHHELHHSRGRDHAPRAVHPDRQSSMVVPPVPPFGTTKSLRIGCSTTGTPGPTRYHGCPVLGCKSVFRKSSSFGVGCPSILLRARYARVSVSLHLGPPTCALR